MSLVSIPFTYSAGAVIIASQHNSCNSVIYSDHNGNIDNSNIAPAAAIVYTKLNLSGSIVNADVATGAAIVGSKLELSSPGTIGNTAPNTGAFTTLKVGTTNQGDILYDNGTSFIRLTPGTNGQVLKTQGVSANPIWGDNSISEYFVAGLGTILLVSLDTSQTWTPNSTRNTTPQILKSYVTTALMSGTLFAKYAVVVSGDDTATHGITVNGAAVTGSNATSGTISAGSISFVAGDTIGFFSYFASGSGGDTCTISNARLYYDAIYPAAPIVPTTGVDHSLSG